MAEEKSAFEGKTFAPPKEFTAKAYIKSREEYERLYQEFLADPPDDAPFPGRIQGGFLQNQRNVVDARRHVLKGDLLVSQDFQDFQRKADLPVHQVFVHIQRTKLW